MTRHTLTDDESYRAHNFVSAVKSRLGTIESIPVEFIDIWQRSFTALFENLSALALLPFFFSNIPSLRVEDFDATPVIDIIHRLTCVATKQPHLQSPHYVHHPAFASSTSICNGKDSSKCTGCKLLGMMFFTLTKAHALSISRDVQTKKIDMSSSWYGGQPIEPRLFRRLLLMLEKDLEKSDHVLLNASKSRNLWFWKAFAAAHALYTSPSDTEERWMKSSTSNSSTSDAEPTLTRRYFHRHLSRWSAVTGIVDWQDAKAILREIAWPRALVKEYASRNVWMEVVGQPSHESLY